MKFLKNILKTLFKIINPVYHLKTNTLFVLFIVGLLLLYIHNSYRVYRKAETYKKLQEKLQETKTEYMTLNAKVGQRKKLSVVLDALKKRGLKPLRKPPYKLEVKKQ